MINFPDFEIESNAEISNEFRKLNIFNFRNAAQFVAGLDYGRNANKNDLKTVFSDNCGTCSTKHALLKKLAQENGFENLKLFLGIFRMNGENTVEISETLKKNNLEFIPEAHNYLKYENVILDFTKVNSSAADFKNDLLLEIEILPNQISDFKVDFHKKYLRDWLNQNQKVNFDLAELWEIREKCIEILGN